MNAISILHRGSRRPPASSPSMFSRLGATAASVTSAELIKRGGYVARLGDCVACHTSPNGAAMAGGLELNTPFGTI